ncbi:MAG TPA: hypothetical protein VFD46_01735 [Chryseolinea sp.]|nr:hypothetical protein [Chryseolinea sp.]
MEVKKTEDGGPVFNVFIKASPEAWYYFGLEDNRLLVHSSNSEFNSIISKKTNGGKAKIGEVAFIPGSDDETLSFINRFRRDYYEIDVPYDLYENAAPVRTPDVPGEEVPQIPTQTEQTPQEDEPIPMKMEKKKKGKKDREEVLPADGDVAPAVEEPKKERKKKEEPKQEEPRQDEPTREEPAKDEPKKDAAEEEDDGF